MSNLTRIPLIDNYRTNLSQEWNGATGTVYVATTPIFTFPSGITTYIVVNPGKTNMQIAEIDSYNSTNKTLNVSNITLEKGASMNSTAQTHTVGSEVIISDNYQFWLDILTAINSKIDTLTGQSAVYTDTTARDTAIPTPSNGMQVYITSEGKFYDYIAGSWTARESGGTFANASATVAGKVEIATTSESKTGTDTGGTGALLSVLPSDIAKNTQSGTFVYGHSTTGSDTYTVSLTPTLTEYTTGMQVRILFDTKNTGACSINIDSLGDKNIKTNIGADPINGSLLSGRIYTMIYNGTDFILETPIHTFAGDGSDGVQGDSDLTITGSNNTVITKNFTSWTAGSVARTCTVTPTNCITHIKIKGDADFTNWAFNFAGKGASGGTAVTSGGNLAGNAGTASTLLYGGAVNSAGAGAGVNEGGGGGSGYSANGSNGGAGASGGTKSTDISLPYFQNKKSIWITNGAGGGSGGVQNGTSGAGGSGGGALIIEVGGNLTFSSTTITVAGDNGADATSFGAGGGGGGGTCIILYSGNLTGTCTPTVSGGAGGNGLSTNGDGGAGGAGAYYIQKNTTWY